MNNNKDQFVAVPANLVQAVMSYLETRPIKEALHMFMALGQCKPVHNDSQGGEQK